MHSDLYFPNCDVELQPADNLRERRKMIVTCCCTTFGGEMIVICCCTLQLNMFLKISGAIARTPAWLACCEV